MKCSDDFHALITLQSAAYVAANDFFLLSFVFDCIIRYGVAHVREIFVYFEFIVDWFVLIRGGQIYSVESLIG